MRTLFQSMSKPLCAMFLWGLFLIQSEAGFGQNIQSTLDGKPPIIIAHRGASGERPEHSLAAFALAMQQGADYIEPDLVMTKDGHLLVRHDRFLSSSTDVADHLEFLNRKIRKPGYAEADWFVEDFTLAEIRTLRARQPRKGRSDQWDDLFSIASFEEVLQLVKDHSERTGHPIGVYAEVKSPDFFRGLRLDPVPPLLAGLKKYGFDTPQSKIYIQSFDANFLKRLKTQTEFPLIQLISPRANIPLTQIKNYAAGVGPAKNMLVDAQGKDNGFVKKAHDLGLKVHAWSFRDDDLHAIFKGEAAAEYNLFFALGIDGLFSDFPESAFTARDELINKQGKLRE